MNRDELIKECVEKVFDTWTTNEDHEYLTQAITEFSKVIDLVQQNTNEWCKPSNCCHGNSPIQNFRSINLNEYHYEPCHCQVKIATQSIEQPEKEQ